MPIFPDILGGPCLHAFEFISPQVFIEKSFKCLNKNKLKTTLQNLSSDVFDTLQLRLLNNCAYIINLFDIFPACISLRKIIVLYFRWADLFNLSGILLRMRSLQSLCFHKPGLFSFCYWKLNLSQMKWKYHKSIRKILSDALFDRSRQNSFDRFFSPLPVLSCWFDVYRWHAVP